MAQVVTRAVPKKRVSNSLCVSSSVAFSVSPDKEYPALLTTMSRWKSGPKCLAASAKALLTEVGDVTSRTNLRILGLLLGRYERSDSFRAVAINRCLGLLAISVAILRPIPEEQPVTEDILSVSTTPQRCENDLLSQTASSGSLYGLVLTGFMMTKGKMVLIDCRWSEILNPVTVTIRRELPLTRGTLNDLYIFDRRREQGSQRYHIRGWLDGVSHYRESSLCL